MAFGRPVKTAVHVAPWPLWKVFGLLAFILLLLFLATLLVGFDACLHKIQRGTFGCLDTTEMCYSHTAGMVAVQERCKHAGI